MSVDLCTLAQGQAGMEVVEPTLEYGPLTPLLTPMAVAQSSLATWAMALDASEAPRSRDARRMVLRCMGSFTGGTETGDEAG
jgi:hypothetical protein